MKLTQHSLCNDVLAAPPGMPIEQCKAAPICRVQYSDNVPAVWTYWKPDPKELEILNSGGDVKVEVLGTTMSPMYVDVSV